MSLEDQLSILELFGVQNPETVNGVIQTTLTSNDISPGSAYGTILMREGWEINVSTGQWSKHV